MTMITTKDGTQISYKDWSSGRPVVFSHGWPLSADAWDNQMMFLGERGYRVIAHDRRGHGRSDQTWHGNDMDTMPTTWPSSSKRSICTTRCWSPTRPAAAKSPATSAVTAASSSRCYWARSHR